MGSDVEVNVTAKPETGEKHLFHEIVIFMDHVVIHPSAIIISSIGIFRKNDDCVSKTRCTHRNGHALLCHIAKFILGACRRNA